MNLCVHCISSSKPSASERRIRVKKNKEVLSWTSFSCYSRAHTPIFFSRLLPCHAVTAAIICKPYHGSYVFHRISRFMNIYRVFNLNFKIALIYNFSHRLNAKHNEKEKPTTVSCISNVYKQIIDHKIIFFFTLNYIFILS